MYSFTKIDLWSTKKNHEPQSTKTNQKLDMYIDATNIKAERHRPSELETFIYHRSCNKKT